MPTEPRRNARRRDRGQRQHRHHEARSRRRHAPAGYEQEHEEEERSDETAGEEEQRGVRAQMWPSDGRAWTVLGGGAESRERHKRHESERHLHEEDRPPAEQLGQDAARPRPERRPENARCHPDARRVRTAARRLGKQVERGDDDERRSDRLDTARGDEQLERPCEPAGKRRRREDHRTGDEGLTWPAPGQQRSGHGDKCEHQVEGREHPGNRRDPDVELSQNLGQRERDDRRVREREPDG